MNIIGLYKKEIKSYFNSPIAYLVVLFFVLFSNIYFLFFNQFIARNVADLRGFFALMPLVFIILIPSITMRSWAEERKSGTEELLLTLPLTNWELVLAKYFSSLTLLLIMLGMTLFVPLTLSALGDFERGQVFGEYFGTFLLGAAGLAIGQFVSSVTSNQISAYIFSVVAILFITLVGDISLFLNPAAAISRLFSYLSFTFHYESFRKGLIDTRGLLYFLLIIFYFLYLNVKVINLRK
ncbi:MAG: ABC transporter permease subunit [Spirochaetaceae bacterium]|nr:ABC transporter permease subunit [Spirochaetaceae bacterium]